MALLTDEERKRAFAATRKPDVIQQQRLPVRFHVEDFAGHDRPRRFLEAFAAILKHTNYRLALDHYIRVTQKCARCTVKCQVYDAPAMLMTSPVTVRNYYCPFTGGISPFPAFCAAGSWAIPG